MDQIIHIHQLTLKMYHRLFIIAILASLSVSGFAQTPDFTGIKVMLNPGHGGHDSDDRGMPNGFWESEGNLTKGLWLRDLLEARGCEVVMSRVENRTEDDLPLSQIAEMANANNVDVFLSIHSNAGNQSSNYCMTIFNGKSESPAIPEAKVWAQVLWQHLVSNQATYWTSIAEHFIGDLTLNPSWTTGYGVLYPLEVPGIISEGSFHDYQPEMDRLLSIEYRYQEAWNMLFALEEYFNLPGNEITGLITGIIRDSLLVKPNYTQPNAADKYEVVNQAKVELLETSKVFNVDSLNTGFYYFDSLTPGNYHLVFSAKGYFNDTVEIEVTAHQFSYLNYWMHADKTMPPDITYINPSNGETINCFDPVTFTFSMNMDSASFAGAFTIEPAIDGAITWDDKKLNATFQPGIPYEMNADYVVTIDSTAKHQWGVALGKIVTTSFHTGNRNRYLVVSSFPQTGQTEVSPYLQFRAIFDAPLDNTSLINAVSIKTEEGAAIGTKGAFIYTIDGKGHYYFSPEQPLEYQKSYTLVLKGTIKDNIHIPLVDDVEIPFSTQAPIPDLTILNEWESLSEWAVDYTNSTNIDQNTFLYKWNKDFRSGAASMLLRYKFLNSSGVVKIIPQSQLLLATEHNHLGMWVWGEMSQNSIGMVFNNSITDTLCTLDFAGWRYCTAAIPAGATEIEYLQLIQSNGGAATGDIYFDALSQFQVTGIKTSEDESSTIRVFPNPAACQQIKVVGLKQNQTVSYQIQSVTAQVVNAGILVTDAFGMTSLDISGLKGQGWHFYLLILEDETHQQALKILIK
ncbi:MAG: hypothetical protein A2W95_19420 [Bacteroidetes bacterium GWA2_40_14]|nr:MAG: hypothetical protein A2W95_19420 [Bacteroidetes bacterium GWA2_40_14]